MENNIAVSYVKKLYVLGDRVVKISNEIPVLKEEVLNEQLCLLFHSKVKLALEGYKSCLNELASLQYPEEIKNPHDKLVNAFETFVSGTELLVNCISITEKKVNLEMYEIGIQKQKNAELETKQAVEEIIVILQKNNISF